MSHEMALSEVIYKCRAMRRLKSDEVPEALLLKLIDAANHAPSGSNAQRGRWVVVRDPAQKNKLADLNRKHAEPCIAPQRESPADAKQKRRLDAVAWQMEHLHEECAALCLIPVGYPMDRFGPVSRRPLEEIMRFDWWY